MVQHIVNDALLPDEAFYLMLKKMWQIRFFEEHVEALYRSGHIHGTLHLSIGQEACAVGSTGLLSHLDWMTSTHRNHGHCLAKGTDPYPMFAESLGGTESLITYPMTQTHESIPAARREMIGITENFIRLSVGIEHVDYIIKDL
mgnify:CR=1 FL=1